MIDSKVVVQNGKSQAEWEERCSRHDSEWAAFLVERVNAIKTVNRWLAE